MEYISPASMRRYKKRIYEQRKAASLCCRCGKPTDGLTRCKECAAAEVQKNKRLRQFRVESGLCERCGKPLPTGTKWKTCFECRTQIAGYYREKYQKAREQG